MGRNNIRSVQLPKAWVIPKWLHALPLFNRLVFTKRTYSNDYTSNTRVVIVLRKRSPEIKLSDRECHDLVYAGAALQETCLCLKTFFCRRFWIDLIRETETDYEMN